MRYLYEDFSAVDGNLITEPTTAILDEITILEAVGEARTNGLQIRVSSISPCLLDWVEKPAPPNATEVKT